MEINEVGKKYQTACENVVEVLAVHEDDGTVTCKYVEIKAKGQEALKGRTDLWKQDGTWPKYPDDKCIHRIVKEL